MKTGVALVLTASIVALVATLLVPAKVEARALEQPLSMTFDTEGRVYIGEKMGAITMAENIGLVEASSEATEVANFSDRVYEFGDHGLTSVHYHEGYIYTTFMVREEQCGDGEYGTNVNTSCPSHGEVARFEVLEDGMLGEFEHVMGGPDDPRFCAEYTSHSLDSVFTGTDGDLYLAAGDGAGYGFVDLGGEDGDPCGEGGAWRAQAQDNMMGKILRLDPKSGDLEVVAKGLRNPFRQTIHNGALYTTNTGWYSYEAIAEVTQGANFGWPCYEGPEPHEQYPEILEGRCDEVQWTEPTHAYAHSGSSAISALASFGDRLYFGDHTEQWIKSVVPGETESERLVMSGEGLFPVDMKVAPDGNLYAINIWTQSIILVEDQTDGTS